MCLFEQQLVDGINASLDRGVTGDCLCNECVLVQTEASRCLQSLRLNIIFPASCNPAVLFAGSRAVALGFQASKAVVEPTLLVLPAGSFDVR